MRIQRLLAPCLSLLLLAAAGGSMTRAVLGRHGNGYFYLLTHSSGDTEGDYPLLKAVLQEWRWKDTGEALGYSVQ